MPAAFSATYSDFKLVKTRKVAQLVFEVPLEAVDAALSVLGGMPDPAAERWYGIAPLNVKQAQPKDKKNWRDMRPAQQAGIRCEEPAFRVFLAETWPEAWREHGEHAADFVRAHCVVNSRADLTTNQKARIIWRDLDDQFQAWKALEHA